MLKVLVNKNGKERLVRVNDLRGASDLVTQIIDDNDYRSSEWYLSPHTGHVYNEMQCIATVSYNGRVWMMDDGKQGAEIILDEVSLEAPVVSTGTRTMNEVAKEIDGKYGRKLCDMWERWQDEKEYEDFKDYVEVFKTMASEVVKGNKRPFGFNAECSDGMLRVGVKLVSSKNLTIEYQHNAKFI